MLLTVIIIRKLRAFPIGVISDFMNKYIKSKSNTQEFARQMKQEEESATADARPPMLGKEEVCSPVLKLHRPRHNIDNPTRRFQNLRPC
jgi:hypothetical protein